MPMWEGEEPQPQEGGPTPKQRLLNWINNKVPELPIKNFTTDWNDGKAIGALVDAIAPGMANFVTCLIMPPTLKKLEGHIALCVCVCGWVSASVNF